MKSNSILPARNLLLLISFLLVFCSETPQRADASEETEAFLKSVEEATENIPALSCHFTQTKTLSLFTEPIIFTGKLFLVRPDKLRWEFTSPVFSALIFNGNEGIRCNEQTKPSRFDLHSDPIMAMVAEQLWTWLDGNYSSLRNKYDLSVTEKDTLQITPRDKATAAIIASITIQFAQENKQPRRVLIKENDGDSTLIEFYNYSLSPSHTAFIFNQCTSDE